MRLASGEVWLLEQLSVPVGAIAPSFRALAWHLKRERMKAGGPVRWLRIREECAVAAPASGEAVAEGSPI